MTEQQINSIADRIAEKLMVIVKKQLEPGGEPFNPALLNAIQEAEKSKEDDLKKVKESIKDGYPNTPEMTLILRIVANWGNAIEMPNMEGWVREYAKGQNPNRERGLSVREKAEQWFKEEVAMIDDEKRKEEVEIEEETYLAVWTAGYRAKEATTQQGAVWLTGQYNRLYDQLKADPGKQIVCFVDYTRDIGGKFHHWRDICTIRGETMEFLSRGCGYGMVRNMKGDEKTNLISLCDEKQVQWLDETEKEASK